MNGVRWTAAEHDTIRRLYPVDIDACVSALPGRTREAVIRQARVIGVSHRPRHWSELENYRLRMLWASGLSLTMIAKRIGRTEWAVFERAREVGLSLGVPDGCEYIKDACARTGYHHKTLWMILRWSGVITHATITKPTRGKRRRYYVDPFDVDEAIKKWHATETVDAAARRLGMSGNGLRHRLKVAGVLTPRGAGSSRHHRIESAVIDRVVAEWKPRARRAA